MNNKLPIAAQRIGDCVIHHAKLVPKQEVAVDGCTRLTYSELADDVTHWAKALLAVGVSHGDRVAMLTPLAMNG